MEWDVLPVGWVRLQLALGSGTGRPHTPLSIQKQVPESEQLSAGEKGGQSEVHHA